MTHVETARSIAETIERGETAALPCRRCGRQGDVIVRRVGDATTTTSDERWDGGGRMIVAGEHGEHRIVAPQARMLSSDTLSLPQGGVLVHTDIPSARHGALALVPGTWRILREQELSVHAVVVQVRD